MQGMTANAIPQLFTPFKWQPLQGVMRLRHGCVWMTRFNRDKNAIEKINDKQFREQTVGYISCL